jgi:hypothetical protein
MELCRLLQSFSKNVQEFKNFHISPHLHIPLPPFEYLINKNIFLVDFELFLG